MNQEHLTRIHIVGGAGSGKTTVACRLAALIGATAYDLDKIAYENGAGPKRPLEARLADVARIASQPGWVTEGIYLGWTDQLLAEADAVLWLDLPWHVTAWRIVVRHARASLSGNNPHAGLRNLAKFVLWTRQYYHGPPIKPHTLGDDIALTRADTAQYLSPLANKIIHCLASSEVEEFLQHIQT